MALQGLVSPVSGLGLGVGVGVFLVHTLTAGGEECECVLCAHACTHSSQHPPLPLRAGE